MTMARRKAMAALPSVLAIAALSEPEASISPDIQDHDMGWLHGQLVDHADEAEHLQQARRGR